MKIPSDDSLWHVTADGHLYLTPAGLALIHDAQASVDIASAPRSALSLLTLPTEVLTLAASFSSVQAFEDLWYVTENSA